VSGPEKIGPNLLVWGKDDIEFKTCAQAATTARLPFVNGHVALMPDAHFGLGSTVGSVIPTQGAIIPAAIGVDIGCGMIAAETYLTVDALPDDLNALHSLIAKNVPSGVGKGWSSNGRSTQSHTMAQYRDIPPFTGATTFDSNQERKVVDQFGTLGSGNHFVEVCTDERDVVWVVLHSGSRGIGNQLAQKHIEGARGLMKKYFIELEDRDLAYLVQGTVEFNQYIADMLWAQDYAAANRERMMSNVLEQLYSVAATLYTPVHSARRINCHHNYTAQEHHHGKDLWITRKGAIRARVGDWGVIPGSMATGTYIVSGRGNEASYCSASHGAGRTMSRKQAKRELTVESLQACMDGKAWNGSGDRAWSVADAEALVDEHPQAYKEIGRVMLAQADLVKVEHVLTSLLNYKGT
jgi:tRNA-splicing ligase RtcB